MSIQSGVILQQWNIWACASASMLGALKRMKPEIDHESLLKEVLADKSSQLTYQRAAGWFMRKWLIKWIRPVKYSPFIAKKQPILTWLVGVDWVTTASTKNLTFKNNWEINSHFIHISAPWVIANSWGDQWGDKWYFYFEQSQIRRFKQCFVIVL